MTSKSQPDDYLIEVYISYDDLALINRIWTEQDEPVFTRGEITRRALVNGLRAIYSAQNAKKPK